MAQDIVISREQARNNQLYQRAKQQAVARGVCLRVQDAPQPKVPMGFSRDASGINLFGVRRDDVRTLAGYEAAKANAAPRGARLCLVDE
jgi:hypothetical protein